MKCNKEFACWQSLFKHTKHCGKLQVEILVLASVMKFLLEQTHCLEMFETSVKVILTRQEIHLYDVYAFKCLIGTNILRDMQKLIYQRTNWHVPVVHNTSEKTDLLCLKQHVNQMKTKVDLDFDKDSVNHAVGYNIWSFFHQYDSWFNVESVGDDFSYADLSMTIPQVLIT